MTKNPFDQFSKQYLEEILAPTSTVEISREIPGEPLAIDLWVVPNPQTLAQRQTLGLLGRIVSQPCALEPYRNAPTPEQINSCILKLSWVTADSHRRAKRDRNRLSREDLPQLWILTPTASKTLLNSLGAQPQKGEPQGVYLAIDALRIGIVAINQLPDTDDTLWLRLLGKGRTQTEAIAQILALPDNDPRRQPTLKLLTTWKIDLNNRPQLDSEEE